MDNLALAIKLTENMIDRNVAVKSVPAKQLRLENELSAKLDRLYAKAFRAIVNRVRDRGIPDGDFERSMMVNNIKILKSQTADLVFADVQIAGEYGQAQAIANMKKAVQRVPLNNVLVTQLKESTFTASSRTINTMIGDVNKRLSKVVRLGLSNQEASVMLRSDFKILRDFELRRIARTEIHNAQQLVNHKTMERVVDYRQWVSAEDDRVREPPESEADHVFMNGQIARMGFSYSNGLMYPGDNSGRIEEWINCRCREVPFIMPLGFTAPMGRDWFFEGDIVKTFTT